MRGTLVAGDTLGGLSRTAGSGAEETLVFGVAIFDDGGEALLPVLSKEPLDPNDCNKIEYENKIEINNNHILLIEHQTINCTCYWQ